MTSSRAAISALLKERSATSLTRLITQFRDHAADDAIATLAEELARSGYCHAPESRSADIASTGGPGSLSTLVGPLYLRCLGYVVPALGLPGRPAGAVDALAQLDGYNVCLSPDRVRRVLDQCGYAHFVGGDLYAPADALLFDIRKSQNAQQSVPLVIASLLSKKLATGVTCVGLDVRVAPHGNFGSTWDSARGNAERFCRVAAHLGITARCYLTDNRIPPQPFLGRGESLLALYKWFTGTANDQLLKHLDHCWGMAADLQTGAVRRPSTSSMLDAFVQNLEAQGSKAAEFEDYAQKIEKAQTSFAAEREGFLSIDTGALRQIIGKAQEESGEPTGAGVFSDPCGVVLTATAGRYVGKNENIAMFRCPTGKRQRFADSLGAVLRVEPIIEGTPGFETVSVA
jgi:thymidine phosphorylase